MSAAVSGRGGPGAGGGGGCVGRKASIPGGGELVEKPGIWGPSETAQASSEGNARPGGPRHHLGDSGMS